MKQDIKEEVKKAISAYKDESAYASLKHLYKHYALTGNSVSSFTGGYLYASRSYQLNDIYDSSPLLVNLKASQCILKKIRMNEMNTSSERVKYDRFGDYISDNWGVISLTPRYKNKLMWSHYSKNDGFSVTFDTKKLIENMKAEGSLGLFAMIYAKSLEPIVIDPGDEDLFPYIPCLIKGRPWRYEKEWRFIIKLNDNENSQKCKYDVGSIAAVHTGYNFFDMERSEYGKQYFFEREGDDSVKICQKAQILNYIRQNDITIFINCRLNLNRSEKESYVKCKIDEINISDHYIKVQHIKNNSPRK